MASSSSTKKAAKLAQKGKGRKVRFQGGTVFPAAVALTLVLGLAAIIYGRATLPTAENTPPTTNDHWHAAYGIYLCDDWYQFSGNLEQTDANGQLVNTKFLRTGIHSHDDGVIHWHPYTSAATGENAVLGVFLDNYGLELTNESIRFEDVAAVGTNADNPPENGFDVVDEYVEGETQCNGEDAEVTIKAWDSYTDTGSGASYIANMDNVRVAKDAMVFAVYFTPKDTPRVMPPWAQNLPALGAVDSGTTGQELLPTHAGDDSGTATESGTATDSGTATESGTATDASSTATDASSTTTD